MEEGLSDSSTAASCCGPEDCAPLDDADVRIVPGGYFIVPSGETIPENRAAEQVRSVLAMPRADDAANKSTRCFALLDSPAVKRAQFVPFLVADDEERVGVRAKRT